MNLPTVTYEQFLEFEPCWARQWKGGKKMIRFRQKREEAGLTQAQTTTALENEGVKITTSDLSKIENGRLLPTPTGAQAMCKIYGTTMAGLADIEDVTFYPVTPRKAAKRRRDKSIRKFAVDLESELASGLKVWLPRLGYRSKREWVVECAMKAQERYNQLQSVATFLQAIEQKKIAASDANTDSEDAGE